MKKNNRQCCSIRFAGKDELDKKPFFIDANYEKQFKGNAWRMGVWTVVFLGMLGNRSNCCGVEIWKNWFIEKHEAPTKADFLTVFRKRLIAEKFDDAVIFELTAPMTLKQFQKFEKQIEQFNNLCKEATNEAG